MIAGIQTDGKLSLLCATEDERGVNMEGLIVVDVIAACTWFICARENKYTSV